MIDEKPNCEDCNDTGLIEVESVILSRPYMINGKKHYDVQSKGDWKMTQCRCID